MSQNTGNTQAFIEAQQYSQFILQNLGAPGVAIEWDQLEDYYRDSSEPTEWQIPRRFEVGFRVEF